MNLPFYWWEGNVLVINILGRPSASRDAIGKSRGAQLKISVTAAPELGQATDHMVRYLAGQFGVSRSAIEVVFGRFNVNKQLRIKAPTKLPAIIGRRVCCSGAFLLFRGVVLACRQIPETRLSYIWAMRSGLLHVFRYFGSESVVSGFLPGKGDGKPSFPSLGISLLFYVLAQLGGDKLGDLFHELNGHRDSVLEKTVACVTAKRIFIIGFALTIAACDSSAKGPDPELARLPVQQLLQKLETSHDLDDKRIALA
ncbi:hypothetical protein D3Y57_08265 [Sphingomonas paeninsulae]|uniref:UPF0235 protein D3Y57_08265 n=1 Tax=Sphingomonas paeninsulae TaxID=2319844 RepID=A0A494TQU8_SPHPE|nr:hypothetical protein D3Y57_08265 [Sphingomonas paeninsulae]